MSAVYTDRTLEYLASDLVELGLDEASALAAAAAHRHRIQVSPSGGIVTVMPPHGMRLFGRPALEALARSIVGERARALAASAHPHHPTDGGPPRAA